MQLVPARHTYIQHVLLNDGVHDDSHQHVEEDSSQVFYPMVEVIYSGLLCTFWTFVTLQSNDNEHIYINIYGFI